jgi:hypothetical protein
VKRLRRIIFNGLTLTSLLLCVAMAVLWVRSYWYTDTAIWSVPPNDRQRVLWSQEGWLHAYWRTKAASNSEISFTSNRFNAGLLPDLSRTTPGITLKRENRYNVVDFAHWQVVGVCAIWPFLAWAYRRRAKGRLSDGRCRLCGYDLRATPDRCPECGAIAAKALD